MVVRGDELCLRTPPCSPAVSPDFQLTRCVGDKSLGWVAYVFNQIIRIQYLDKCKIVCKAKIVEALLR